MTIALEPVDDQLPIDFHKLELDARADGHANMTRLSAEFAGTPSMFHRVIAAHVDTVLAGIGAITDEPVSAGQPAWRMRRLYVHRDFRRAGVARTIAADLLRAAAGKVEIVTVHAGSDDAARFWEEMGFDPVAGQGWSHQRRP
ncbi:GNAT superfamily N-acetyltransferase [Bradyrhizobium sp. USDA 4369]